MILVTGGTGLLGAHLLYRLVAQGNSVRAVYRDTSKFEAVKRIFSYYSEIPDVLFGKIEWVNADITDVPALDIAFDTISQVYHCAADLSFNPKNYSQSRQVNVVGTANIVNLCLSNKVSKLCHVSSIATLGEDLKKPITEDTPWNPENNTQNIYAITKYDAELEVWRGTQEGLNAVVVQPGVILGPGLWNSGSGEIFTKVSKGFHYYTSGTVGVVDVNDVTKSMVNLMNSEIVNEQFIVVSENVSYKELVQKVSKSIGCKKELKEIKRWQLLCYLQIDKLVSFISGRKRSVFKANINSAFKQLEYDASKIKKAVGVEFISVKESVENTACFYEA
ncbi:MAG: NAD-dependent epimerase/dehydratase family protein [Flavobacteriaceae bacterium]|nr:NAD-dependent epimerase/dehydratase family protein [Flavobacteriaceae bacterium]